MEYSNRSQVEERYFILNQGRGYDAAGRTIYTDNL